MVRRKNAYLTVYMALCLMLMLSLCLTLIEGTRRMAVRTEAECVADISLCSTFAEYHRELYEQYNLFALDTSYGTKNASLGNTEMHLREYMDRNFSIEEVLLDRFLYRDLLSMRTKSVELTGVRYLTDEEGAELRRLAGNVILDDVGLSLLEEVQDWISVIESNGLQERDWEEEYAQCEDELKGALPEEITEADGLWKKAGVGNPASSIVAVRTSGLLSVVLPQGETLSDKAISTEALYLDRKEKENLSTGNLDAPEERNALLERFLFHEYLLRYFGSYEEGKDSGALTYQVEYLLEGKETDAENLEGVVRRLCLLREGANAAYLYNDAEKCQAVETLALALAILVHVPDLKDPLKHLFLLTWSFAESLHDVSVLLEGGRVPLLKDGETWHYSLENIFNLTRVSGGDAGSGLSYADYLRIFLMLSGTQTLTDRALTMMEADIRLTEGNPFFCMDACVSMLTVELTVESGYGYSFLLTRERRYE